MKRLKRSLSLRSSRRHIPESHRPQVWENDSYKVRNGGVSFPVKYVGAIEVTESRGTQVCAEAFRKMKEAGVSKKKRMTLLVTSDCLRLVDEETKSLVIDQTIEKVSFCTPDPTDDRVFSYICREGTTRRWMCHCFIAIRDTGERLSHAVGCAFTACLQRKQKAQSLQQQAKVKEDTTPQQDGQPTATVSAPSGSPQSQTPQQQQQQQTLRQLASTVSSTPASATTGTSPIMNGPTSTSGATSSPQPTVPVQMTTQQQTPVQPVLKPPPAVARPRPQPFAPSPFTRHMSLRYRSTPMSLMPLRDSAKGYETLEEEAAMQVPKLPPTVDALALQSSSTSVPPNQHALPSNSMQTSGFPRMQATPQQMPTSSQGAPTYNGMHPATVSNSTVTQLQYGVAPVAQSSAQQFASQQAVAKPWGISPQPHQQLERKLSDAEMWLASAEGTAKDSSSGQGLLTTVNPFSDTSTQIDALSSAWTQDMNAALPANRTSQNAWRGAGLPKLQEDDEFASLASRHTGSPLGSPRSPAANPFAKGSEVYWV